MKLRFNQNIWYMSIKCFEKKFYGYYVETNNKKRFDVNMKFPYICEINLTFGNYWMINVKDPATAETI